MTSTRTFRAVSQQARTINIQFAVSGINAGGGTATTDPASTTEAPKNTDPNGTTADPSKTTAAGETTTTAAGGSNGGSSNGSSSGSSNGSTNNATTSQTGDFGIAAIVLGAVATRLWAQAHTPSPERRSNRLLESIILDNLIFSFLPL